MYDDPFDGFGELSDSELDLLDSVLRMFPGGGNVVKALDTYIEYEAKRCHDSSDGKWHWEFLAELRALRAKLADNGDKQAHAGVDWALVQRLIDGG